MNYTNETLRNALAAEYVLGTLRGKARQRFQKLMMQSQLIAETTWIWEQYLNGMGENLTPIQPDDSVWRNIESQLGFRNPSSNVESIDVVRPKNTIWKAATSLAAAASLIFALLWFNSTTTSVAPVTHIAVVNDQATNPLWLIEVSETRLRVRATDQLVAIQDKDYELWIVPANGNAPISLGLLPRDGEIDVAAPAALRSVAINVLAVSLEPLGGSPTGSPTEVLYTSPLLSV